MLRLVKARAGARIQLFSATAVRHATCFAWDCSGSTHHQEVYHDLTAAIFEDVKAASERGDHSLRIVAWHDVKDEVSESELLRRTSAREGRNGTQPSLIAKWVNENDFKGRLVIVTDGQVSQGEVDMADALIGSRAFERVDCHLLETSSCSPCNMSVPAAFVRHSPHTTLHYQAAVRERDGTLPVPHVIADVTREDMGILDRLSDAIKTPEQFLEKLATIKSAVIARTMGKTSDPALRDSLLALKRRLVATGAAEAARSDAVTALQTALMHGKTEEAVAAGASILRAHHAELNGIDDAEEAANWRLQLDRLVSMCEGALRDVFDLSGVKAAVAGDRWRRAAAVTAPAAPSDSDTDYCTDWSDAESSGSDDAVFQCPMTPAQPSDLAILVKSGPASVLEGETYHVTNDIFDCPLNIFKYDHIVEKLVSRLDHPVSLRSMQNTQAAGSPLTRSPTTRDKVAGALVLGESKEHCDASRWTLAQALMDGKLVGNADLWMAVIWLLVENGVAGTGHLVPALPQLRQQMTYRLKNHTTFISMSGLPELPTARVTLGAAVWFVLSQPAIATALTTGGGDQARTAHDALRAHITHVEQLESLLGLTGYALPAGCKDHIAKVRATLAMLSYVKRYEAGVFNGRTALPAAVRVLYQRAERVDREKLGADVRDRLQLVEWVAVDGAATHEQQEAVKATLPAACHRIDTAELYAMGSLLDKNQAAGDVDVPFPFTAPALPVPVVNWPAYAAKHDDRATPLARVPICSATCRPFYDIGAGITWKEAATRKWGAEPTQLISLPAMFARFVCAYERYPTADEFILYLLERYSNMKTTSRRDTLPANIRQMVQECLASFETVTAVIEPAEFKRRARASVDVTKRRAMEAEWRTTATAAAPTGSGPAAHQSEAAGVQAGGAAAATHHASASELADNAAKALTELYEDRRIDAATLMAQLQSLPPLTFSAPGEVASALIALEAAKKTPPLAIADMLRTLVDHTVDNHHRLAADFVFRSVRNHRQSLDTQYYLTLIQGLGGGKMA